jgi:hypothetical protein
MNRLQEVVEGNLPIFIPCLIPSVTASEVKANVNAREAVFSRRLGEAQNERVTGSVVLVC